MSDKTNELTAILDDALNIAREHHHPKMTPEHILLSILDDKQVVAAIEACDAAVPTIKSMVVDYVSTAIEPGFSDDDPAPDEAAERIIQRAAIVIKTSQGAKGPEAQRLYRFHVLTSILAETSLWSSKLLTDQFGVTRYDVTNWAHHGVRKGDQREMDARQTAPATVRGSKHKTASSPSSGRTGSGMLDRFTDNLTAAAKDGLIQPAIAREDEIQRAIRILCRKEKSCPVFVGEAGVGKTKMAEGLALEIAKGRVPAPLKGAQLLRVDMAAIMAGCKFRGDFEERFKGIVEEASGDTKVILFIDEIHTILDAGNSGGDTLGAGDILKPALARGEVSCMGATTQKEYRSVFEKDAGLARRFQKVVIEEPTRDDAIEMVTRAANQLGDHHNVEFTDEVVAHAVDLSIRYIRDRKLPDKAIDVLDETASIYSSATDRDGDATMVDRAAIEESVALIAGVPVNAGSAADVQNLKTLKAKLSGRVFGQDHAIEIVSTAIKVARSGLGDPNKPIGSFLFLGSTGVGKTELTKALAEELDLELLRFDMSEYMEKHAVARLIGAPPGYVGYEGGGQLTEKVNKKPYSIVLLDEIEKAHPEIFDVLLQVMDHGTLTDGQGREVDFRNTILIMTSNAGASAMAKPGLGFGSKAPAAAEDNADVIQMFRPEFRNRLDAMPVFKPLAQDVIAMVARSLVKEVGERLKAKDVELIASEEAIAWLGRNGYDAQMGARPMKRLVFKKVSTPLSEEVLFGTLAQGGVANLAVDTETGELTVSTKAA